MISFRLDTITTGILARVGSQLISLDISKFGPTEYGLRAGLVDALVAHCTQLYSINMNNRLVDREWLIRFAIATEHTMQHVFMAMVIDVNVQNATKSPF